jgi:predicted metalloprotease with PDZ domain
VVTYRLEDVVAALNRVAPYDWASFLGQRVYQPAPAPVAGIDRGGYRLVWKAEPNAYDASAMKRAKTLYLHYSAGFTVGSDGKISNVMWDGPAHSAGVTPGGTIVAVNGREYGDDELKSAITAAKGSNQPIRLLLKERGRYREVELPYYGGLRYPHIEKAVARTAMLDRLLAALP